jgi:O-antigen/teichoic acid export membrane protein
MNYFVLLKNAFANVVRGGASAFVALLLPPFLTSLLPSTTYGTWILVLQISTYVNFFDFGIQTAVGRYVAYAREKKDFNQCDRIVSTAFVLLVGSSALAILMLVLLTWQIPNLFPEMPFDLQSDARWTLLVVGVVLGLGLPFSVFNGIFIGLQRNEIPAIIIGGSKLLGGLFVILMAYLTRNIVLMGIAISITNLFGYLLQFLVYTKLNLNIHLNLVNVSRQTLRELTSYCISLTIWAFGMLLVNGIDTAVVGYFDYSAVAYYATAAGLITFLNGIQAAIFTALMPAVASLDARNDKVALGKLLITSTRYGLMLLFLTGLPLIFFAQEIIRLWVGNDYAIHGYIILQILVVANIIRSSLIPYSILLIGTGQQRLLIVSPFAEGFSNLLVSVIAGYYLGPIGVAVGTLFGSIVLWFFCLFYNMPRTDKIPFARSLYLLEATLQPFVLGLIPLVILALLKYEVQLTLVVVVIVTAGLVVGSGLIWNTCLTIAERQKLHSCFHFMFHYE